MYVSRLILASAVRRAKSGVHLKPFLGTSELVCVQLGHLVVTLPALTECAADLVTSGFAEPEAVFAIVFSSTLSWESDLTERNLALQVNAGAPVRRDRD